MDKITITAKTPIKLSEVEKEDIIEYLEDIGLENIKIEVEQEYK